MESKRNAGDIPMQITNKLLFLKYAIPCTNTLVKRGWITQERVDKMHELLKQERVEEDIGSIYLVATSACKAIAFHKGKKEVDEDVIHEYFLDSHDEMIDKRFKQMGDFDPEECRTYPGKVLIVGEKIKLMTPRGEKEISNTFVNELNQDDYVITHYNHIIEKITKEKAKDLWDKKEQYIEDFKQFE